MMPMASQNAVSHFDIGKDEIGGQPTKAPFEAEWENAVSSEFASTAAIAWDVGGRLGDQHRRDAVQEGLRTDRSSSISALRRPCT